MCCQNRVEGVTTVTPACLTSTLCYIQLSPNHSMWSPYEIGLTRQTIRPRKLLHSLLSLACLGLLATTQCCRGLRVGIQIRLPASHCSTTVFNLLTYIAISFISSFIQLTSREVIGINVTWQYHTERSVQNMVFTVPNWYNNDCRHKEIAKGRDIHIMITNTCILHEISCYASLNDSHLTSCKAFCNVPCICLNYISRNIHLTPKTTASSLSDYTLIMKYWWHAKNISEK